MADTALLRQPEFRRFLLSRLAGTAASQMLLVALVLAGASAAGWLGRRALLGVSVLLGALRAYQMPASQDARAGQRGEFSLHRRVQPVGRIRIRRHGGLVGPCSIGGLGGVGTGLVVLAWTGLFPSLARHDRLTPTPGDKGAQA